MPTMIEYCDMYEFDSYSLLHPQIDRISSALVHTVAIICLLIRVGIGDGFYAFSLNFAVCVVVYVFPLAVVMHTVKVCGMSMFVLFGYFMKRSSL